MWNSYNHLFLKTFFEIFPPKDFLFLPLKEINHGINFMKFLIVDNTFVKYN